LLSCVKYARLRRKIGIKRVEKIMGDLTRAANHLTLEQVKEKMKEVKDPRQLQRWQIIYKALLSREKQKR
jgi:hypothetical protein